MPDVAASEGPEAYRRPRGSGFWTVAFAFLIVMAVATLPSPLYGLDRTRDHLSALTITVVFAIFAGSTIGVLERDSAIAARIGRRAKHRARLRHPRRARRRRLGLGTAGTPSAIPRRDLTTTGRRDDMSTYFRTAWVQEVAS